jgi:hypothetical protein
LSSKSEINKTASEKKKKQSKRKFDNFKCSVSNRKLKKLLRKLLQQQLSDNNKCNNTLVFSSHKDQKYSQSIILLLQ